MAARSSCRPIDGSILTWTMGIHRTQSPNQRITTIISIDWALENAVENDPGSRSFSCFGSRGSGGCHRGILRSFTCSGYICPVGGDRSNIRMNDCAVGIVPNPNSGERMTIVSKLLVAHPLDSKIDRPSQRMVGASRIRIRRFLTISAHHDEPSSSEMVAHLRYLGNQSKVGGMGAACPAIE